MVSENRNVPVPLTHEQGTLNREMVTRHQWDS